MPSSDKNVIKLINKRFQYYQTMLTLPSKRLTMSRDTAEKPKALWA
jgi:hypothetical protein